MSAQTPDNDPRSLVAHIRKHHQHLDDIFAETLAAMDVDIPKLGKTPRSGGLIAGLLESYYTCAETVFFRISQFFENSLSGDRWHKDLLEKMTLEIENLRPRVLSEESFTDLTELMRFRHFKRYYFGTAYDWIRLDELLVRIKRVHPNVQRELLAFVSFLKDFEK